MQLLFLRLLSQFRERRLSRKQTVLLFNVEGELCLLAGNEATHLILTVFFKLWSKIVRLKKKAPHELYTHNKTYCLKIQHPRHLTTSDLHLLLLSHPAYISSDQGWAFSRLMYSECPRKSFRHRCRVEDHSFLGQPALIRGPNLG